MSLSLTEIRRVVEELRPLLVGGRLQNAAQDAAATLVLTFYAQRAKRHLLIAATPGLSRLHLVAERPVGTGDLPPFVRSVRQALRGRLLLSVEVAEGDRIVELAFGRPGEPAGRLVAELTGRTSNLYHVGPAGRIVALLRPVRKSDRDLRPGAPYEPPPPGPISRAAAADRFAAVVEAGEVASCGEAIERFYAAAEADERLRSLRSALASRLRAARKKTARLLANLEADLASAEDADRLRLCGELLKLRLHDIPPRCSSVALPNPFDPGSPEVQVPLAPHLSARQNMERYFRRYKKLKAARQQAEARAAEARKRIDLLDTKALAVQEATTLAQLESLAEELGHRRPPRAARRRAAGQPRGPYRFLSAEGHEILVGRTAAQNDELTFRIARGNDLWLHVEGYAGSHVVVRVPKGRTVPKETLLDAAALAVHFSQLRRAGGGPVAYCACKHVTKPRGAKAGETLYSQNKTLHVTVERSRLDRLMRGNRPGELSG